MRFLEIIKSKLNKEKTQKAQTEEPQQNLLDAEGLSFILLIGDQLAFAKR